MSDLEPIQMGITAFVVLAANFLVLGLILRSRMEIAEVTGLVDDPAKKAHARHKGRVPLIGGVAFVATFFVTIAVLTAALALVGGVVLPSGIRVSFLAFLLFIGLFHGLGLADDLHQLSARRRLVLSFGFVALLIWMSGDLFLLTSVEDAFLGVTVGFGSFAAVATGVAIIALINAFNMSDGRNGIVAGITAIWACALALKSTDTVATAILTLCAVNALVLGWYNLKNRLFFGDAGTYAIAAMFGATVVFGHEHGFAGERLTSLQVCSLFLVLVLDMIRLIILRTRAGRSPMSADHNHLHHRLDDHFGWPAGLIVYLALVAFPIGIAFQNFPAAGAMGVGLGSVLYLAAILYTRSPQQKPTANTEAAPPLPEV